MDAVYVSTLTLFKDCDFISSDWDWASVCLGQGSCVITFYLNKTYLLLKFGASLMTQMINNLPAMLETWIQSLGGEDPWRRERLPIPFLPEEFHGQGLQTLEDTKELDMPERLTISFSL